MFPAPVVIYFRTPDFKGNPGAGGLATKSYIGTALQSDLQAARCLVMRYCKNQFDEIGTVVYFYVMCLVLGPWNASDMYAGSPEDMFFNLMVAYYLVLENVMLLQEVFGDEWIKHSHPLQTFLNTLTIIGLLIARLLSYPKDVPFRACKQREFAEELHFSEVKKNGRGMAKLMDLIRGTSFFQSIPKPLQSIPKHSK